MSPTKIEEDEDQVLLREKEGTQLWRLLLRAKRFMVQRKYEEALSVCNTYFHSLLDPRKFHPRRANAEEKNVLLTIQCSVSEHQQKEPLMLRLSWANKEEDDKSPFFDPFAVVAMQCWHKMEEQHNKTVEKKPLLDVLPLQSIKMELFYVWMKYWQTLGLWKEALEWNMQILIKLLSSSSNGEDSFKDNNNANNTTIRVEFIIQCLGHQLPRVVDSNLASDIAKSLLGAVRSKEKNEAAQGDLNLYILALSMVEDPIVQSIHAVRLVCESNSIEHLISKEAWQEIRRSWEMYNSKINKPEQNEETEAAGDGSNKQVANQSDYSPMPTITGGSRPWKWVDTVVCWIRDQVRDTIDHLSRNPQLKSQVTISLTLTLLAWRQMGILKVMLGYILSPLKELMDALKLTN